MRLTCDYYFRIPTYRYIQDLFDTHSWNQSGMDILDKMRGVCFTTNITYPPPHVDHPKSVEIEMRPEQAEDERQILELTQFIPSKIIKGF